MAFVAWVLSGRSGRVAGTVVLAGAVVVGGVATWADAQQARIPLTRWIDGIELRAAEARLGFRLTETGGNEGTFLLAPRANGPAATAEARRLGVLKP